MNTTENNKLIAEFMGVKFKDDEQYIKELREMRSEGIYFEQGYMTSELKYHSSWDWLMPVVEKVNKVCGYDDYNTHRLHIQRVFADCVFENAVRKKEVHKAVVEFIKWYNSKT